MRHFIFLIVLYAANISANEAIYVDQAWIRAVPPVSMMTAGYMQVHNSSQSTKVLVSASSERFKSIEMHHTIHKDGSARMQQQHNINITNTKPFQFKPGGFHLMLMYPIKPLKRGERIPVTLHFADGSTVMVHFLVRGH